MNPPKATTPASEAQYRRMMETPIPRLVTSLAVPTVIGMLITVIYNTADTYFVSQINKSASAAVGAVYAVMAIIQALGYGLGVGAGSLISRKLGAKENEAASRYASSAFFAAVLVGGIISVPGLLVLEPFLRLLGCTDTMMPYAIPYARFILIGAPVSCATFVLSNALRSEGYSTLATVGVSAGGILNVILDPILILGCDMGTGGAALATVISQAASFLILLVIFLSGKSIVKLGARYISRSFGDYRLIAATGLPTICRQGLGSLAAAVLNIQAIAYGGDAAGAAITIAGKVYVLARNIVIGFGQGFQPVAGYNYGAGNRRRAWQSFTFAAWVGSVVCVLFAAATVLFAEPIMWWFCEDAEVAYIGIRYIRLSGAVMPFMAFSTYVNQLYQCLGFKGQATFLASCRQGIFFLPAVLLLPLGLRTLGVVAAQPLADFCTFVTSIPFLVLFRRRYVRGNEGSNQNSRKSYKLQKYANQRRITMDFSTLAKTRQSTRSYDPTRPVESEKLTAILESARLSPSACNGQPYHVTVCRGDAAAKVAKAVQGMGMNKFASDAPILLAISEKPYVSTAALGAKVKGIDYRSIDMGILAAYITAEATEQGLGTCILGWLDSDRIREICHLDGDVKLVITLGYAKEGDKLREKKRKDLSELVSEVE